MIQYNSTVAACKWNDDACLWNVTVNVTKGEEVVEVQEWKSKWLVLAIGALYLPNVGGLDRSSAVLLFIPRSFAFQWPKIDGLESFSGERFHTSRWPREKIDFTGKRVAVIGTGSSGVQSIPVIAKEAAQLTVFQRTPNYSIPANNRPVTPEELKQAKEDVAKLRELAWNNAIGWGVFVDPDSYKNWEELSEEEREARLDLVWNAGGLFTYLTFKDQFTNVEAAEAVSAMIRKRIKQIVKDPETAEILTPHHLLGCKRICAGEVSPLYTSMF